MKKLRTRQFLPFVFVLIALYSCMKNRDVEPEIPIYSSFNDIINPPDTFRVVFALRSLSNYYALINFESNAVWEVHRVNNPGDYFTEAYVIRTQDTATKNPYRFISQLKQDTLVVGFNGGIDYSFIARRTSSNTENVNLILNFVKTENAFNPANTIDQVIDGSQ